MKSTVKFAVCIAFIISTIVATAQENTQSETIVGKEAYDRLNETMREYNEIIKTGDSLRVAEVCYLIGKRYVSLGDYYNADKWFYRALRILEPLGPSESVGKIYGYLNGTSLKNNQFEQPILNLQKAIVNFKSVGAEERLMSAYVMISSIYTLRNKAREKEPGSYSKLTIDSASYYRDLADKLGRKIKNLTHAGNIDYSIDNTFARNDTNTIIKSHLKTYNTALKQRNTQKIFSATLSLAEAYLIYNNYSEAKNWLKTAFFIADTTNIGSYDQKVGLLKLYSELNKKTDNYKEALDYFEKYHELELKGIKADQEGAVSRLRIQYETEKKERALKEQRKATEIAILVGFLTLIVSVVFFWLFWKYKIISKQNAILVAEQNHRVKNNFQHISNLIALQIARLEDIKIKNELNETFLRIDAMALVQKRLYDRKNLFEVETYSWIAELTNGILKSYSIFNCSPEYKVDRFLLHVDQAITLGLVLNELITNACKYAFTANNHTPTLRIECNLNNDFVDLVVNDNGPGFDIQKSRGFGLKLIEGLSDSLKGSYRFINNGKEFHLSFKKTSN